MSERHPNNTPETRAEIERLRKENWYWEHIATHFGVSSKTIRRWVGESRRPAEIRSHGGPRHVTRDRIKPRELEQKLREIPPDTRTPVQRLLGDPPFQRSALYAKRGET